MPQPLPPLPGHPAPGRAASPAGGRRPLLVVGAALAEEVYAVPAVPRPGGHVWLRHIASAVGGSALNVLRMLVRLGYAPTAALTVGTGTAAARVQAELTALGTPSLLPAHGQDNGVCHTLVTPDGERTFLTVPGCEMDWSPAQLAALAVPADAVVYVSGFQLLAAGGQLAQWAASLSDDVALVLDPGARLGELAELPEWAAVRERCDVLTINEQEATALLVAEEDGESCHADAGSLEARLSTWAGRHRCDVVLRQGSRGATWLAADGAAPVHAPAVPVRVVDTDGAGDAHTAGIMAALADGFDAAHALELAGRAAAVVVAVAGPAGYD
ncbi:PfkB family carbohydrate kinase [Actinomyces sp. MRS3W]|uniref:PfkB family carbohydrate kinase n=1 Tax=Actinomyces sp. MRS3W TaxID=2800796 RepID=UPI0028FD68B9|nr:PfkB family carbohydrate kinase [Actinomyces sp. MRS3W]MDU0348332.1 PfkB family carbohydrate kinase [Actinomyces sp. MRS3W]